MEEGPYIQLNSSENDASNSSRNDASVIPAEISSEFRADFNRLKLYSNKIFSSLKIGSDFMK